MKPKPKTLRAETKPEKAGKPNELRASSRRATSRDHRSQSRLSPIATRIAEVTERDLGDGWHPIAIIQARISGRFCDVRCVHSKGVQEVIRTYFKEEVERNEESNQEGKDDDIPF
jgi:capsid protein